MSGIMGLIGALLGGIVLGIGVAVGMKFLNRGG